MQPEHGSTGPVEKQTEPTEEGSLVDLLVEPQLEGLKLAGGNVVGQPWQLLLRCLQRQGAGRQRKVGAGGGGSSSAAAVAVSMLPGSRPSVMLCTTAPQMSGSCLRGRVGNQTYLENLAGVHGAKGICGEVTKQAGRPVDVLQHALGVAVRGAAQVLLHFLQRQGRRGCKVGQGGGRGIGALPTVVPRGGLILLLLLRMCAAEATKSAKVNKSQSPSLPAGQATWFHRAGRSFTSMLPSTSARSSSYLQAGSTSGGRRLHTQYSSTHKWSA